MLIGKGLIASQFKKYEDDNDIIIFASGVSNSQEIDLNKFDKEFNLIKKYISCDCLFVYFSTCSIYDKSLIDSKYVKHKLKVEEFIKENFKYFLILYISVSITYYRTTVPQNTQ